MQLEEFATTEIQKSKEVEKKEKAKVAARFASSKKSKVIRTIVKSKNENVSLAHSVNAWLAEAVGTLNAMLFVCICLCGIIGAIIQFIRSESSFDYAMAPVFLILSVLWGLFVCGFLALICSIQADLHTLRKSVHNIKIVQKQNSLKNEPQA